MSQESRLPNVGGRDASVYRTDARNAEGRRMGGRPGECLRTWADAACPSFLGHFSAEMGVESMIQYYVDQIAEAISRIEFTSQQLHARQNNWELDPEDGMYVFKGFIDPFIVKKHVVDLVREVWHLYDGTREFLNAKWQAGQLEVEGTNLDKGRGPGKAIVDLHVSGSRPIQLCGDLANLTKHYKLTRATKTGDTPPTIGESMLKGIITGKLDFSTAPNGARTIKLERPVPMRPTLVVLAEDGTQIGDAVEIALQARDSWLELLTRCGCTFTPPSKP